MAMVDVQPLVLSMVGLALDYHTLALVPVRMLPRQDGRLLLVLPGMALRSMYGAPRAGRPFVSNGLPEMAIEGSWTIWPRVIV